MAYVKNTRNIVVAINTPLIARFINDGGAYVCLCRADADGLYLYDYSGTGAVDILDREYFKHSRKSIDDIVAVSPIMIRRSHILILAIPQKSSTFTHKD